MSKQWIFTRYGRHASYSDAKKKVKFEVKGRASKPYILLSNLYYSDKRNASEIPAQALITALRKIASHVCFTDASYLYAGDTRVRRCLLPEKFDMYRGALPTYNNTFAHNNEIMAVRAFTKRLVNKEELTENNMHRINKAKANKNTDWKGFWNTMLGRQRSTNVLDNFRFMGIIMPDLFVLGTFRAFSRSNRASGEGDSKRRKRS